MIAYDSILITYFSWVFFSHCESLCDRISKYILKYFIFLNISDKIRYFKNWIKNLKPALDWLETNFRVLSKFVWDWLLNHRWKSKKFWLSLTFQEGKKTEKENHYSCLERNCFQIVVSQLSQMALLFFSGIDGILKRPEENRWGFSFLMSQKVDEGKGYLSRIVCFKYIGLLYHLIDSIRDMVSSYSLIFQWWETCLMSILVEIVYILGKKVSWNMLQMSYVLVKNTYICIYNLCTLYSNNNKAIPIITYRICVYGAYTYAYMYTCMCVFKIVLRAALWNEFYSYFTDEETRPRERQDTQDPKVRREHDQTSRLCSESPYNLVACLWNMPYSIFTATSTSVV